MLKISKLKVISALIMSVFCGVTLSNQTHAATITFDQDIDTIPFTRTVTGVSNPVTNTFTYTITADAGNPDTVTNVPTTSTVVFNATNPSSNTTTEAGAIDFSGATFNTVGDYYFTITETSSTNDFLYPIDNTTYTAQVSVRYATNGGTTDMNTFVVTLAQNMQKEGGDKEAAVWSSASPRTYFEISAETNGNSADKDHCFTYLLNIPAENGISADDTFVVNNSTCTENPTTITAGEDTTIKLKDGDTLTIGLLNNLAQLPIGSSYTITLADAEGYDVTFNGNDSEASIAQTISDLASQSSQDFDKNNASFVLTKNTGVPNTGIFTNNTIYIIFFGISIAGLAVYITRKYAHRK